jgi:hypothetical protein
MKSFREIQALGQERIREDAAEMNLWRAVIGQALDDLSQPKLHQAAMDWLASTEHGPGSFRWICDHLDLNPSAVSAALNKANKLKAKLSTLGNSLRADSNWIVREEGNSR